MTAYFEVVCLERQGSRNNSADPADRVQPSTLHWRTGGAAGSDPGTFWSPNSLVYYDGALYVVDTGNRRVQVLSPVDGSVVTTWSTDEMGDAVVPVYAVVVDGKLVICGVSEVGQLRPQYLYVRDRDLGNNWGANLRTVFATYSLAGTLLGLTDPMSLGGALNLRTRDGSLYLYTLSINSYSPPFGITGAEQLHTLELGVDDVVVYVSARAAGFATLDGWDFDVFSSVDGVDWGFVFANRSTLLTTLDTTAQTSQVGECKFRNYTTGLYFAPKPSAIAVHDNEIYFTGVELTWGTTYWTDWDTVGAENCRWNPVEAIPLNATALAGHSLPNYNAIDADYLIANAMGWAFDGDTAFVLLRRTRDHGNPPSPGSNTLSVAMDTHGWLHRVFAYLGAVYHATRQKTSPTWSSPALVVGDGAEPRILALTDGRLRVDYEDTGTGAVVTLHSSDDGETWS